MKRNGGKKLSFLADTRVSAKQSKCLSFQMAINVLLAKKY
jgi:hypothetical protein